MNEDFSRFHPVWNVPREHADLFRMAAEIFSQEGFGNLVVTILGEEEERPLVTASFIREGSGEPAVFAEALAACGYQAKVNEGLPEADIRRRMVGGAERLRTDQQFRQYVMSRSLAPIVSELETAVNKVKFVAELSNASPEATERLLAEELRQKFDFLPEM